MKTANNIIFSMISLIASVLSSVLLVPLVVGTLGVEAYGYIGIGAVLINVGTILSLAITSMSTRFIVISLNKNEDIKPLFSSIFFGCIAISIVLSVLFIVIVMALPHVMVISESYLTQTRITFLMMGASLVATIIATPFLAAQYYRNDLRLYYCFTAASQIARVLVPFLLFSFFPWLWLPYLASCVVDVVAVFAYIASCKKMIPGIAIRPSLASLGLIKQIVSSGSWVSVSKAGSVLMSTISAYITNLLVGPYASGIFSSISQLQSLFAVFTSALVSSLVPNILKFYSDLSLKDFVNWLRGYIRGVAIAVGSLSAIAIVYAVPFFSLWLGINMEEYYGVIVLLLLAAGLSYPFEVHNQALIAMNLVKVPALVTVAFGIANVILALIFDEAFGLGLIGIALAQAATSVLRSWLFFPLYLAIKGHADKAKLYIPSFAGVTALLLSSLIAWGLSCFLPSAEGWLPFIGDCIICTLIAVAASYVLFLTKNEKQNFIKHCFQRLNLKGQ